MKTKSFAMLAVTGLLTASIAYVAPAMAEDSGTGLPMEQTLADNNSGSSMQAPSDNSTQNQSSGAQQNDMSGNIGSSSSGNNTSGSSDEGSPDTATGDDDY